MEFFEKLDKNPYQDLFWNVPEGRKRGRVAVIGGNSQSFRTPVAVSEFLSKKFPLEEVRAVLPMSLKNKLPTLPNLSFLNDVEGGSFSDSAELTKVIDSVDFSLIVGDLSKNSVTLRAVASACQNSAKPLLITRDAVDLIASEGLEETLMRKDFTVMGSIPQWQKIFKTAYYPKILQQSQPLMQVVEAFHKFTLSYPVQVVSLHEGQILIAFNGRVVAVPLTKTELSPLTVWNGELAAKILALNLYNPGKFIEASVSAIFG